MDAEKELLLNLEDNEWPHTSIDHDRLIVRAIVVDDVDNYYFVRANRHNIYFMTGTVIVNELE